MKYLKLFNESIIDGDDFLFKKIDGGSGANLYEDWISTHNPIEINENELSILKDKFEPILLRNNIYWRKRPSDMIRRHETLDNINTKQSKVLSWYNNSVADIIFLKYDDNWWIVNVIKNDFDGDGDEIVVEYLYICDGIEGLDALVDHLKNNPLK